MRNPNCCKCGGPVEESRIYKQGYCKNCHAEHMRNNRPRHSELPELAKKKAIARSYLKTYVKRGKVVKLPCEICGSERSEAHHEDYDKPLEVVWLCREHHLELHEAKKVKHNSRVAP